MNVLNTSTPKCSVHITTNRNRIKTYDSIVYLKDGQKFELEIHNPHSFKVLCMIKMNGGYISQNGIIIRPGEKVYLERYIDKNKSFKFSTYEVEDGKENEKAIENNGSIIVEFYSEHFILTSLCANGTTITTNTTTWPLGNITYTSGAAYYDNLISSNSVETGRIEEGEKTDQSFTYSNDSFNHFAFETCSLKILPTSHKNVEVNEIRNYCTNCGTRIKKVSWKFCPSCGDKI